MEDKAKQRALGAYPQEMDGYCENNASMRVGFKIGYNQAEKDLELSWEDVYGILYSERMVMREWFKEHKEKNIAEDDSNEVFCSEVLKRFNKQRKEK